MEACLIACGGMCRMDSFKQGAFSVAVKAGVRVVPVTLLGTLRIDCKAILSCMPHVLRPPGYAGRDG